MKVLKTVVLTGVILLSGCAGSGQNTAPDNSVSWWNPLTYSWSSALPWHWFGSSVRVSDQGVGKITSLTPMDETALRQALGSDYQLRQGMRTENGDIVTFWQALKEGQVMMDIQGQSTVSRIVVSDKSVTSVGGISQGSKFSALYSKAFGNCRAADSGSGVLCKAPDSQHIEYLYQGEGHGPQGLMPADDTLKNWTLSQIIWHE